MGRISLAALATLPISTCPKERKVSAALDRARRRSQRDQRRESEHRAREAAVNWQQRAGHKVAGGRAEEQRRADQVVGSAPAAAGGTLDDALVQAGDVLTGGDGQIGVDPA